MTYTLPKSNDHSNFTYASFWERLGALMLDGIILWILLSFLGNLLNEKPEHVFIGIIFTVKGSALQVGVSWLYFAFQESSSFEGTVGKRAFKLRVTDDTGQRISFAKASLRYFSKCISAVILCIGFLMMLWNNDRKTLHDKIANTLVIK